MSARLLDIGLTGLNVQLTTSARGQLLDHVALIAKWNKVHNLTAIRDTDRMVVEHILDSLSILPHVLPGRILDIGTGAGLPGIPLAVARPDWHVTLLDSSHKKCAFLRQALIELGVRNATVVCERVEVYRPPTHFDTVVSRAFSETQHFARSAARHVTDEGILLAMKGLYPHEELAQLPPEVVLKEVVPLVVPGLDARRHLVVMTKA